MFLLCVFVSLFGLDRAQTAMDFENYVLEQLTNRIVPAKIFDCSGNIKTKD